MQISREIQLNLLLWSSFEDDGTILISDKLDSLNRESLNINDEIKIPVSEVMKKYLKRHREKFNK